MARAKNGRFAAGASGNPRGRPKGSSPVAALRAQIGEAVPGILEAMVTKAQDGDAAAARLLLERVLPPIKADELSTPIDLTGATLTDKAEAVVQALANGDISPSHAATLLSALGSLAKAREVDELERRIAALEAKGGKDGKH